MDLVTRLAVRLGRDAAGRLWAIDRDGYIHDTDSWKYRWVCPVSGCGWVATYRADHSKHSKAAHPGRIHKIRKIFCVPIRDYFLDGPGIPVTRASTTAAEFVRGIYGMRATPSFISAYLDRHRCYTLQGRGNELQRTVLLIALPLPQPSEAPTIASAPSPTSVPSPAPADSSNDTDDDAMDVDYSDEADDASVPAANISPAPAASPSPVFSMRPPTSTDLGRIAYNAVGTDQYMRQRMYNTRMHNDFLAPPTVPPAPATPINSIQMAMNAPTPDDTDEDEDEDENMDDGTFDDSALRKPGQLPFDKDRF